MIYTVMVFISAFPFYAYERKMRDLGLTFEPATLRAALKRQGKGGK